MGYEIDFLPVGEGEKSGDAIALRYGNLHGPRAEQTVITIDGGTTESGDALVEHITNFYRTDTVDIAFLSHPDNDHASGMRRVVEKLKVRQIVMHLPWNHSAAVNELLNDNRVTPNSLQERTRRNLASAHEVYETAIEKGISVIEPFAGTKNDNLIVLGPTKEFYEAALANFKFMPGTESAGSSIGGLLAKFAEKATSWIQENWFTEHLYEPAIDAVRPENNSSIIMLLSIDNQKILLTGDAGVLALSAAVDYAEQNGISLAGINLLHVPHHGSRRNLGPTILNRLFGRIRQTDEKTWSAAVSVAKNATRKHPHRKITNALRRRGAVVKVTAGQTLGYALNAPDRGWVAAPEVPFYNQVENDD